MSASELLGLILSFLAFAVTVFLYTRPSKQERRLAERSDARSMLAEGAIVLSRLRNASLNTFREHLAHAFQIQTAELEQTVAAVRVALDGLGVSFASDTEIMVEFSEALIVTRVLIAIWRVEQCSRAARAQLRLPPPAHIVDVTQLISELDRHIDAYMTAARRIAEVKLVTL